MSKRNCRKIHESLRKQYCRWCEESGHAECPHHTQISAMTAQIRSAWSEAERNRRSVVKLNEPMTVLESGATVLVNGVMCVIDKDTLQ